MPYSSHGGVQYMPYSSHGGVQYMPYSSHGWKPGRLFNPAGVI